MSFLRRIRSYWSVEIIGIVKNLSYLSSIQIVTLISPFLYYPYLLKVLGPEKYGSIILIQSVFIILSLFVEFGFNLYGTKEVAKFKDNRKKLSKFVSNVLYCKIFIFFIISIAVIFSVNFSLEVSELTRVLVLLFIPVLLNDVFFLQWYFQGIEKIRVSATNNLVTKVILCVLILFFIDNTNDFIYFPIIFSIVTLISSSISLFYVFRVDKVALDSPDVLYCFKLLKESFVFFYSKFFVSLLLRLNVVLVGYTLGPVFLAFYDMTSKLINLLMIPFFMINQAIYPVVVRTGNLNITKITIYITFPLALLSVLGLYLFGNDIYYLLSGVLSPVNNTVMAMFALYLPFQSVSIFLGNTMLVVKNKNKEFGDSVTYGLLVYALFLVLGYMMDVLSIEMFIILQLLASASTFVHRFYLCYFKYKFLRG